MKNLLFISAFLFLGIAFAKAQSMEAVLQKYNQHSVPYISVQELAMNYEDYVVLDVRTKEEFEVSHLPGAVWVEDPKARAKIASPNSNIVVYCTIGVRSEDYGEQLLDAGFTNVKNLHGSIFSWKDAGFELVDNKNQPTEKVHTYSKAWSKYLKTGVKVF